ncbi:probable protein S-acyltransferase 1 [Salvia miltiorrhiza]|uniref:probable protein S-acyltransferase 1 n=1 Tax=Salvia miltiorrhiza TaxID=226208 RepID=UPI0025AC7778|nr:probable protein S-acyltransferase 1 [Salvia miltiorrhiza]
MASTESDAKTEFTAVENGETKANLTVLRQQLVSAKRIFSERLLKSFHGDRSDDRTTRLYHVWPGNNVFFCGGRLVCGPDPRGLVLTTMAVVMSSWSFAAYVANDDVSRDSSVKIICCVILTFIVLVNLGVVSTIDPGIIPRSDRPLVESTTEEVEVEVEGIKVRLKYCRICNIYQTPRSHHCLVCDNCVEKFDRHCPLIGQCIGLRNYRLYVLFLFMALVFFAYICAFSLQKLGHKMAQNDVDLIVTFALASFSIGATLLLGVLTCYNLYLIAINQTSCENILQYYASSQNPYDKGILSNFMEALRWSTPPPKVDFRSEVIYDQV